MRQRRARRRHDLYCLKELLVHKHHKNLQKGGLRYALTNYHLSCIINGSIYNFNYCKLYYAAINFPDFCPVSSRLFVGSCINNKRKLVNTTYIRMSDACVKVEQSTIIDCTNCT